LPARRAGAACGCRGVRDVAHGGAGQVDEGHGDAEPRCPRCESKRCRGSAVCGQRRGRILKRRREYRFATGMQDGPGPPQEIGTEVGAEQACHSLAQARVDARGAAAAALPPQPAAGRRRRQPVPGAASLGRRARGPGGGGGTLHL
jgi:hypothetical protein